MEELWTKFRRGLYRLDYDEEVFVLPYTLQDMASYFVQSDDVEAFKVVFSSAKKLRKKVLLIQSINAGRLDIVKAIFDTGYTIDVYKILPDIKTRHGLEFVAWNGGCDLLENSDGCLELLTRKWTHYYTEFIEALVEYGVATDKRIIQGEYFFDYFMSRELKQPDLLGFPSQNVVNARILKRLLKIQPRIIMSEENWEAIRPHLPLDIQELQDKTQAWERRRGLVLGTGRY